MSQDYQEMVESFHILIDIEAFLWYIQETNQKRLKNKM
jgi:hypothetical protein